MAKQAAKTAVAVASVHPDALTLCAISKCVKERAYNEARASVLAGTYEISTKIVVRGVLSVAPDSPGALASEAAQRFNPWTLLSLAMKSKGAPGVAELSAAATKLALAGGAPANEQALALAFALEADARLPKLPLPAGSMKRGTCAFAGLVQLALD